MVTIIEKRFVNYFLLHIGFAELSHSNLAITRPFIFPLTDWFNLNVLIVNTDFLVLNWLSSEETS